MQRSKIIPEQKLGVKTDTEHSIIAETREDALKIFKKAKARMLNINMWHTLAGAASAEFKLVNINGDDHSLAQVGDYFKIDIPAPETKSGKGHDWVKVEKIEDFSNPGEEEESCMMQVRPCSNPENDTIDTAHFLSEEATSTFLLQRQNTTITASVHGRNEKPNIKAENILDKIRNLFVGTGAIAGASKVQWKLLVKGLLS